jgi:hypothetical protein
MRVRIWKDGLWCWSIHRPGYRLGGRAHSWAAALRHVLRELSLDKAA